jgi:hypothetical protein
MNRPENPPIGSKYLMVSNEHEFISKGAVVTLVSADTDREGNRIYASDEMALFSAGGGTPRLVWWSRLRPFRNEER